MKKVLITGADSYIGVSFENWVKENCSEILINTIDMRGDAWKKEHFGGYASVFHVAGLAHADVGKVTEEQKKFYYKINTDLAIECARKAKNDGVKQFIFMSSMIVYGKSGKIGKQKMITGKTPTDPENFYGDSKVKAEEGLRKLETENFKVVILRPPMIYGRGSKGNYPLLVKMAVKLPFFPKEKNKRSMLYVGNLCKFVSLMILNDEKGTFFPQNTDYVCTSDMVGAIAKAKGKRIYLWRIFHPFLLLMGHLGGKPGNLVNKAFGNMTYDKELSSYKEVYQIYGFEESIYLTEGIGRN